MMEAIVSSAEAAFRFMTEGTIRKKAETGDEKAKQIITFLEQDSRYINVIEVILTGTSLVIGAVFSARLVLYSEISLKMLHIVWHPKIIRMILLIGIIILFFYLVILFGNILPKKLAAKNPERVAYKRASFMLGLVYFLKPFLLLLENTTKLILFFLRIDPNKLEENVTQEEIISIVNEGHEQGLLEANEAEMISNIIEFDEKEVKDIMTHRKKIVAINVEMTIEEAIHVMLKENYSRFPLYEENIDNIVGILHLKDITRYFVSEKDNKEHLKSIAREPYFVPDTQNIAVLFNDMQLKKIHMAIVIDEYGQTAGIVAMEDILEEIVGNILDEYDIDERFIVAQGNNRYIMRGLASLDEVEEQLQIRIEQDEFDTLNGFLISLIGRIPIDGEKIEITYQGYRFYIFDVKDKMIRLIRVTKERKKAANK